ncbi:hypothetical protein Vadar_022115 [Vaccinium darrowii]|uniref:Uncharacterized protein n=1 Tax=Vaccinium darrowii TaxID=229202 RepID=A0ACB7Z5I2_9ERIC|nr:hypothetical protein Vadar_022115 [Vaccinium darrowii]
MRKGWRTSLRLVKPGGVLVYSTCSIDPGENEERVAAFPLRHPEFWVDPVDSYVSTDFVTEYDFYSSNPVKHSVDGAFAARLTSPSSRTEELGLTSSMRIAEDEEPVDGYSTLQNPNPNFLLLLLYSLTLFFNNICTNLRHKKCHEIELRIDPRLVSVPSVGTLRSNPSLLTRRYLICLCIVSSDLHSEFFYISIIKQQERVEKFWSMDQTGFGMEHNTPRGQEDDAMRTLHIVYDEALFELRRNSREARGTPVVRIADFLFTERMKNRISEWHDGLLLNRNGGFEVMDCY